MNNKLVDKYIGLSLAYKVFCLDRKEFEQLNMWPVYLDKLDAVTDQIKEDFYALKKDLIIKHHLDIKMISGLEYSVNGDIYTYTSDQLKEMTKETMRHYLLSVEAVPKARMWKD